MALRKDDIDYLAHMHRISFTQHQNKMPLLLQGMEQKRVYDEDHLEGLVEALQLVHRDDLANELLMGIGEVVGDTRGIKRKHSSISPAVPTALISKYPPHV